MEDKDFSKLTKCSFCKNTFSFEYSFCPHCGTVKPYLGNIRNVGLIILNCLDSLRVNCGRSLLTSILLASKKEYVIKNLTRNDFFGSLQGKYTSKEVLERIDYLIKKEYVTSYDSDEKFQRPLIKITDKGKKAVEEADTEIIREVV